MWENRRVRRPILQTRGWRCQGGERITPALTFTTALAFRRGKEMMFMPPFCFWVLSGPFRKPAQRSFDLAFGVAARDSAGSGSLQARFDSLLAVLHPGNEFAPRLCGPARPGRRERLSCTRASLRQTLPLVH